MDCFESRMLNCVGVTIVTCICKLYVVRRLITPQACRPLYPVGPSVDLQCSRSSRAEYKFSYKHCTCRTHVGIHFFRSLNFGEIQRQSLPDCSCRFPSKGRCRVFYCSYPASRHSFGPLTQNVCSAQTTSQRLPHRIRTYGNHCRRKNYLVYRTFYNKS